MYHLKGNSQLSEIENAVNDLPFAFGNIISDYKSIDLLTLNRWKSGGNNERSPVSPISVTGNLSDIVKMNKRILKCKILYWS